MSRPPVFRPAAIADIEAIWRYTTGRWGAAQAERYLTQIRDACASLASGARIGRDASSIRPGYRTFRAGRHLVFHRLHADGTVEIVRILHERMDPERHLDA